MRRGGYLQWRDRLHDGGNGFCLYEQRGMLFRVLRRWRLLRDCVYGNVFGV
jgi:hypothetical protein